MDNEKWVKITHPIGSGEYQVSSMGRLKNKNGTIKSQWTEKSGYNTVSLENNGEWKTWLVHRIVAFFFVSNPNRKPHVNHKNGIKTDNTVGNLEWVTRKENSRHAYENGLMRLLPKGQSHISSKLTDKQVIDIYKSKENGVVLGKKYNVCKGTIYAIRAGKSWSHITGKYFNAVR